MINLNETSRNDILTSLKKLKLTGMVDSYDEILSIAIKRQSTLPFVLYELLKSEIKTRKLKAIKTQMTAARFPESKDLHDFIFTDTPINSEQVMNLYGCGFVRTARTIILVGGTGTGKSHLAYLLVERLRALTLQGTELMAAQAQTIRLKILKIGTVIIKNTRRIRFMLSSHYPFKDLFYQVLHNLVPP